MERIDKVSAATKYSDYCLRRCEACGIGASNTDNPHTVTFIYRDPLGNIPIESREGASEALNQALNVRNRETKRRRFGFSTSEDAVTWVVFTYLFRFDQLLPALRRVGLLADKTSAVAPTLLLWGVPIGDGPRGTVIRKNLSDLCTSLNEDPNSFSEPDVIINLGQGTDLIFIEVKYRSGNDFQTDDYSGWSRYAAAPRLAWQFKNVKTSGCYELARNWCLLKGLAAERPAELVSLGPQNCFLAKKARAGSLC